MRDSETVLREARELNALVTIRIDAFIKRFGRRPTLYVDGRGRIDVDACDAHIRAVGAR